MEHDKEHFRDSLLYLWFKSGCWSSEIYSAPSVKTWVSTVSMIQKGWFIFERQKMFRLTKSSKMPKCRHWWIKTRLEKLTEVLNVGKHNISDRVLHAIEKIQKKGKRFHLNCLNWLFKIV